MRYLPLYFLFLVNTLLSQETKNPENTEHFCFQLDLGELNNMDIYSIVKDRQDVLYFGTDQGLFAYKYNQLSKVEPFNNQKGSSIFQLQLNSKGDVFCCNLSGQIFQVGNDKLDLVYEFPQEQIKSNFIFFVLNESDFICAGKSIEIVRNEKLSQNLLLQLNEGEEWYNGVRANDSTLYFTSFYREYVVRITPGKVDKIPFHKDLHSEKIPVVYCFSEEWMATDQGQFWNSSNENFVTVDRKENQNYKYKLLNDSLIFLEARNSGGRLVQLKENGLLDWEQFLSRTYISTSYYADGVLYLGTFNQGLYVCPDIKTYAFGSVANASGLKVLSDTSCVVVANTGEVYQVFDTLKKIDHSDINLDKVFQQLSINSIDELVYNKEGFFGHGIIKDLYNTENGFYFTSNLGLFYVTNSYEEILWNSIPPVEKELFRVYRLGKDHRYKSVAYHKLSDKIFYSDPQGTYCRLVGEEIEDTLSVSGQNFVSNDIEVCNDRVVCATANKGLVIFQNGDLIDLINTETGLLSNSIQKLRICDNLLYLLTAKGIQVLNLNSLELMDFGKREGVMNEGVRDFDVYENTLWVLDGEKIKSLDRYSVFNPLSNLKLYVDSIKVGDYKVSNDNMVFGHEDNNLTAYIDFRDEVIKSESYIYYKLEGIEEEWNIESGSHNKVSYASLLPGSYTLIIKVVHNNEESEVYQVSFQIDAPYYQKWWFYLLIVLAGGLIALLLFRVYIKRENRKLKQQNELNASKLTAIQSQMNPHFIFNALNSIQDLVLKGDKKNSYTYITKFANLVRRTLNYSDKDLIEFSQEVKLIELYLTLEKLRFKTDFEYELNFPETEVLVPPMLVQPFIENALVHGLLHKEGLRKLDITFELKESMVCTITDNGVGRKKAAEIKNRQRGEEHESFSVNAIKKRFEILGEYYGGDFGYEYVDLEENGAPAGTKVILTLPAIHKY